MFSVTPPTYRETQPNQERTPGVRSPQSGTASPHLTGWVIRGNDHGDTERRRPAGTGGVWVRESGLFVRSFLRVDRLEDLYLGLSVVIHGHRG